MLFCFHKFYYLKIICLLPFFPYKIPQMTLKTKNEISYNASTFTLNTNYKRSCVKVAFDFM